MGNRKGVDTAAFSALAPPAADPMNQAGSSFGTPLRGSTASHLLGECNRPSPTSAMSLLDSARRQSMPSSLPNLRYQHTNLSQTGASAMVPPAPKVPIPRLIKDKATQVSQDKQRVVNACSTCRSRKVKCSGTKPSCTHCTLYKITCVYEHGKREKEKQETRVANTRINELVACLKRTLIHAGPEEAQDIQMVLHAEPSKTPPMDLPSTMLHTNDHSSTTSHANHDRSLPTLQLSLKRPRDATANGAGSDNESDMAGSVGSTETVDKLDDDINRTASSRATGFLGPTSNAQGLRRLAQENKMLAGIDARPEAPYGRPGSSEEATQGRVDAETERHGNKSKPPVGHVSYYSYMCDDNGILQEDVDPLTWPTETIATRLLTLFFDNVHGDFPILSRLMLKDKFTTYFAAVAKGGAVEHPPPQWRAQINLIFAIAARHSDLIGAALPNGDGDHRVYFTRARMVGFTGDSFFAHPDLEQVQILGLLTFYFISISQINRAWVISGMCVRNAYDLGFHLRNVDEQLPAATKELRGRIWWAVFSMERCLGVMTGRPSAIAEANYTLPLPLPYEVDAIITPSGQIVVQDWGIRVDGYSQMTRLEELGFFYRPRPQPRTYLEALRVDQARMGTKDDGSCLSAYDMPPYLQPFVTAPKDKDAAEAPRSAKLRRMSLSTMDPCTGMFFRLKTQLAIITEQVLMALDSPGAMSKSWEDIQGSITALDASLQQWLMLVPPTFDFRQPVRNEKYARERLTLGLFYYSAHLILGRPCLCRLDRRMTHQSAGSASFNYLRAQLCVHAALAMVNLLPDQPDPIALYRTGPWWCAVHFMMQAVIVLMLEMSYSAYHMPNEIERIMASAKKVTRWLRLMSKNDETAMNAWVIVTRNLTEVAMKNQLDVSDIETRPLSGKRRTCNVFGVGNPYSPQQNTSTQQPQYPHQDSTSQDQDGTGTSQTEQRDDTITPPWLQQHLYPHLNPTIPAYNPTLATTSAWSSAVHSVPVPTSTISTGAEFQGAWTDEPSPSFFTSLGDNSTLNPYAYTFPSTYTTMPQLTLAPSADFPPPWSQPVHPLPPDFPRPLSLRPTPPGPHWIDEQTDAVFENAMRDWERFQRDEARR